MESLIAGRSHAAAEFKSSEQLAKHPSNSNLYNPSSRAWAGSNLSVLIRRPEVSTILDFSHVEQPAVHLLHAESVEQEEVAAYTARKPSTHASTVALYNTLHKDVIIRINKYTLQFVDKRQSTLEQEFLRSSNDVLRMKIVSFLGTLIDLIWVLATLLSNRTSYWETTITAAYARIPFIVVSIILFILVNKYPDFFKQYYQATMLVYSVLAVISTVAVQVTDGLVGKKPALLSYGSALQYMLVLSMYCVYTGLLWRYSCIIQILLVFLVFVLSPLDGAAIHGVGFVVVMIMASLVVNLCASYSSEYHKRHRFIKVWLHNEIHSKVDQVLQDLLPPSVCKALRDNSTDRSLQVVDSPLGDTLMTWSFPQISVLFVGIADFADFVERQTSTNLFRILNELLGEFDKKVQEYNLYKIEYIEGDYVVTSPIVRDLNEKHQDCATTTAEAGRLLALAFELFKIGKNFQFEGRNLELKLKAGISTGPSVSGIIGSSRKFYRLFGDTVNTASRMKSYGESGRVQITFETYELLKADEHFKKLGHVGRTLEVKGKGTMTTYLIDDTPAFWRSFTGIPFAYLGKHSNEQTADTDAAGQNTSDSQANKPDTSKRGELRAWSKKFVNPALEAQYSTTRMEHRVTATEVSAKVSAFCMLAYALAVAAFQPRLDIVERSLIFPLIGLAFAAMVLLMRFGPMKTATITDNKQLKTMILLMTMLDFMCVMIVSVIVPGDYTFVSLQLWINVMVLTGAGVGHAAGGLSAGFVLFIVIMTGLGSPPPVPWVLRMLALGLFVVLYCSFTQSRQRYMWFLDVLVKLEVAYAETLLSSMLPTFVIVELASTDSINTLDCENVVVLFSDISGFTKLSATLTPTELVQIMDTIYRRFDNLLMEFNLYKMDTIGDAYVVVGGLDGGNERNVRNVVFRMVEVADGMNRILAGYREESRHDIQMRIGIHRGPAIAGVVGQMKPRFHVFGRTIEIANKLESDGPKGQIHISKIIAEDIFRYYNLVHRYDEAETMVTEQELIGSATFVIKGKIDTTRVHQRRSSTVDRLFYTGVEGSSRPPQRLRDILGTGGIDPRPFEETSPKEQIAKRQSRRIPSSLRRKRGQTADGSLSPKTPQFPGYGGDSTPPYVHAVANKRPQTLSLGESRAFARAHSYSARFLRRGFSETLDTVADAMERGAAQAVQGASRDRVSETSLSSLEHSTVLDIPEEEHVEGNLDGALERFREQRRADDIEPPSQPQSPSGSSREQSQAETTPVSRTIQSIFKAPQARDWLTADSVTIGMSTI